MDNIYEKTYIKDKLIDLIKKEQGIYVDENENLFEIGLNSLTVMKIVAYWKKEGYNIKFSDLLKRPYIYEWAELLLHAERQEHKQVEKKVNMYEPFSMTDVQYAYWIGRGKEQFLGNIGCHGYFEVDTREINLQKLQKAWEILFEYHPMLRARFLESGKQVIMKSPYQKNIHVIDLSEKDEKEKERYLLKIRNERSHRLLKIEEGQVIALEISILGNNKYRLHFDIDLLVCDVQSFQIILRDIAAYYVNETLPPVKKEWNFASYLETQKGNRQVAEDMDKKFWSEKLDFISEAPKLPYIREYMLKQEVRFKRHQYEISLEKTEMLKNYAKEIGVTLATLILTIYGMVISKWSENKKFVINVPLFNRDSADDIDEVVADFTNLILVEMDFEKEKSFIEYAKEIQKQFQESIDHSNYSGIQILRDLKKTRDAFAGAPIVFSCNIGTPLISKDFKNAFGEITYMISQTPQVLIDFQLFTLDDGMLFVWDAVDAAFPDYMVTEMFNTLIDTINIVSDNDKWSNKVEVLPASQKTHRDAAVDFLEKDVPNKTLIEEIFSNALNNPQQVALIEAYSGCKMTYAELVEASRKMAGFLKINGVEKKTRVAIITERNVETIIAMLAVQLCGGAYIPIQPLQPLERLKLIIESAEVFYILASKQYIEKFSVIEKKCWMDVHLGMNFTRSFNGNEAEPNNPAYIIYTSGSTGIPKGVEITHRSAMNTIEAINEKFLVNEQDIAIGVSAFDFDLSVYDIFGMLNAGGKLILVPPEAWRNAEKWTQIIEEYKITIWNSAPSLAKMLLTDMEYKNKIGNSLRYMFLSGDWITLDIPKRLSKVFPMTKLIAMGGATEASIWSNYIEVKYPFPEWWKSIPYGYPLKNQMYRVVDKKGADCPDYVKGELWIGGAGVANRYVGDNKLTREKFVMKYGKRWYRTGDTGRYWRNGTLEFMGREDNQVKVRGHRIELGEIETKIKEYPEIDDCFVIVQRMKGNEKLEAVVTLNHRQEWTEDNKNYIKEKIFGELQIGIYEAKDDFKFYDECRNLRKYILNRIIKKIETGGSDIHEKYDRLVQGWKDEVSNLESNSVNEKLEKNCLLETFMAPFIENINILLGYDKERKNEIIMQENFVSPNEVSLQMKGGIYSIEVIEKIIHAYCDYYGNNKIRILEVGARSISATKALANKFKNIEYVILDSSRYYLNRVETELGDLENVRLVVGDLEAIIIPELLNLEFDLIVFNNTLHQFSNVENVLRMASDLLKKYGCVVFSEMVVPFPLEDLSTAFFKKAYTDIRKDTKRMVLDKNEWNQIINSAGMEFIKKYPEEDFTKEYPLYVYIACNKWGSTQDKLNGLKKFLKDRLPDYMIPQNYYPIPMMPITNNGKIDRKLLVKKLENIEENRIEIHHSEEKWSEIERKLAVIWKSVLNTKVYRDSNYFRLGGDSLLATQLSAEIKKHFNIDFSIENVFMKQNFSEMAEYIGKQLSESVQTKEIFETDEKNRFEPFPLTEVQQAYWIGKEGGYVLGNVDAHCYFEMECDELNIDLAQKCFRRLIDHHDMMRAIVLNGGEYQKVLQEVPKYVIKIHDFRGVSDEAIEIKELEIRNQLSHQTFNLEEWPLFDIQAAIKNRNKTKLFISFNNIIFDGWSMFMLFRQWKELYENPEVDLPDIKLTYRDYLLALPKIQDKNKYAEDVDYWKNRVLELPEAPKLPLQTLPELIKEQRFLRCENHISIAEWETLKGLAQDRGITPAALLITTYAEILSRWSERQELTINLTRFNRTQIHEDVQQIIGDFTSLTLLGIDLRKQEKFEYRVKCVQEQLWKDISHSSVSGIYVERELEAIEAGRGRMPVVFTSGLGLEENVQDNQYLGTIGYGISQTPQIWLDHQVAERNGELILTWDYVDGLFPDQMIQDMFSCYIKLLKKLCRKEYWSFSVSEMLTVPKSEERTRANRTEKNIPRDTLVSLFMKQVRSSGMESAIISEERVLTYREVDDLSSGLMKAIKNAPMGVGKITAVLMEKSWQQVVAVLGILKAGSAYIPIDATLPKERVKLLLEKSGACTIISQKGIEEKFGTNFNKNWITIESVQAVESNEDNSVFSELAYVIFTSGSTGEPKGVMITHENVMNTILDVNERIDLNQKDRVFALSNLNFDLSVFDIFGVLLVGGAIVIPKQFDIKNPRKWLELIEQHHVTVWNTVPASAEMLIEYANGQGIFQTNIRKVLLSGDWIPVDLPERIRKITKGVEIFSLGGATEGSIWSIIYKIEEGCFFQTSIPYGKPLANQRFYILNERMEECPDMVPGELFISGKGVAKGYWNDPQKTKERFVPDPKVPGEMMYATGDIGRYLKSGDIEFLGREDYQVKVNGYRIELGEIEHYIRLNHAVKDTVVIKGSDNRLVAFLVLTDNQEQLKELLDDWLRSRLPAYMIPSEYIYLKKIPLTPNHKIDKKELLNTIKNETKENRKKMPTTETEKIISSIWEDVLGYADPSVEDDFFSNGGNSLMAVRFVNAINKKMGLELSLQSLFSNSKISEIAALLDKNISEYEDMGSI